MTKLYEVISDTVFAKRIRDNFHRMPGRNNRGQWRALHAVDGEGVMRSMLCRATLAAPNGHDLTLLEIRVESPASGGKPKAMTYGYGLTHDNQLHITRPAAATSPREIVLWAEHDLPIHPAMAIDINTLPTVTHIVEDSDDPDSEISYALRPERLRQHSITIEKRVWPFGENEIFMHLRLTNAAVSIPIPDSDCLTAEEIPQLIAVLAEIAREAPLETGIDYDAIHDDQDFHDIFYPSTKLG